MQTIITPSLLSFIPVELRPDAVVSQAEPSLAVSDIEIRSYLRASLTSEEMSAELDRISDLGEQRMAMGDRALLGLGGARTYQDVGTPPSINDWLHDHELKRINQLKLALPSPGEEAEAARERIAQRIAARKLARQSRQVA